MPTNESMQKPSFAYDLIFVLVLSAIMTAIAYGILLLGNYYGVLVTVSSFIPIGKLQ